MDAPPPQSGPQPLDQWAPRCAPVGVTAARRLDAGDRGGGAQWRADDPLLTSRGPASSHARAACGWCSAASWIFPPGAQLFDQTVATSPWWPTGLLPNPAQRPPGFFRPGGVLELEACGTGFAKWGPWP